MESEEIWGGEGGGKRRAGGSLVRCGDRLQPAETLASKLSSVLRGGHGRVASDVGGLGGGGVASCQLGLQLN